MLAVAVEGAGVDEMGIPNRSTSAMSQRPRPESDKLAAVSVIGSENAPSSSGGESDTGDELVRFFLALPPDARREYESLAELDRRFGEDIFAEHRASAEPTKKSER